MADQITPRAKDFSNWYQDLVLHSKLADHSPVKGCMVIRPNGYAIWEEIQKELDRRIKAIGAQNAYFPLFIPEGFLKKEAEHVEGFAPQCAVVTYAGARVLEEKLVVRPTSETIINSMFAKWIQSYRDLPLVINQWANVVRWEMRTRLFLRTTEFLWQEGHSCHKTAQEAEAKAQEALLLYRDFSQSVLAMPVVMGLKTQSEKFAGAERTYSIEAMMQDGKALQAGTAHYLASGFAKAFNTRFLDSDSKEKLVFQSSWGVTTRLIGGVVMTHSDDRGLILPPRLAFIHVVIIPVFSKSCPPSILLKKAEEIREKIEKINFPDHWNMSWKIKIDSDESKQLGWKRSEYELLGVPLRIEFGARDLENQEVSLTRRDNLKKELVLIEVLAEGILQKLLDMQQDLYQLAFKRQEAASHRITEYARFKKVLDTDGGFIYAPWCGQAYCEEQIKLETKASIRCLPFLSEQKLLPQAVSEPCLYCLNKTPDSVEALFARSY